MSTADEINARIAGAVKDIDTRVQAMTERVNAMTARINKEVTLAKMIEGYKNGEPIKYYTWEYVSTWQVGRRCAIGEKLLLPGTRAYKGTIVDSSTIGDSATFFMYPEEMWLSKEEFTMRRLKGLV